MLEIYPKLYYKNEEIRLTGISGDEAEKLAELLLEKKAGLFYQAESFVPETHEHCVRILQNDWHAPPHDFAFAVKAGEALLALVNLEGRDLNSRRGEFGLGILPEYRGKGLAYPISLLFMDYCFGELNLHRLFFRYLQGNKASESLAKSLGFTYEGCFRSYQRRGHVYLDAYLFSMLEDEYSALKPKLLQNEALQSFLLPSDNSEKRALPAEKQSISETEEAK